MKSLAYLLRSANHLEWLVRPCYPTLNQYMPPTTASSQLSKVTIIMPRYNFTVYWTYNKGKPGSIARSRLSVVVLYSLYETFLTRDVNVGTTGPINLISNAVSPGFSLYCKPMN